MKNLMIENSMVAGIASDPYLSGARECTHRHAIQPKLAPPATIGEALERTTMPCPHWDGDVIEDARGVRQVGFSCPICGESYYYQDECCPAAGESGPAEVNCWELLDGAMDWGRGTNIAAEHGFVRGLAMERLGEVLSELPDRRLDTAAPASASWVQELDVCRGDGPATWRNVFAVVGALGSEAQWFVEAVLPWLRSCLANNRSTPPSDSLPG